jgi:hypothetical protein
MEKDINRVIKVTSDALDLLKMPGMTVERLRELRESFIRTSDLSNEQQALYYDSIMAAIEIMTSKHIF